MDMGPWGPTLLYIWEEVMERALSKPVEGGNQMETWVSFCYGASHGVTSGSARKLVFGTGMRLQVTLGRWWEPRSNLTMCCFKTVATTEGLSWLDIVLPPFQWRWSHWGYLHSVRICVIFISITESFLSSCENRLLSAPRFFSLHILCVSVGTVGLGINLSSGHHPGSRTKRGLKWRLESAAYSGNFSGAIRAIGRKWARWPSNDCFREIVRKLA